MDSCRSKRCGIPLTDLGEEDTKRSANPIRYVANAPQLSPSLNAAKISRGGVEENGV